MWKELYGITSKNYVDKGKQKGISRLHAFLKGKWLIRNKYSTAQKVKKVQC